MYKTLIAMAWLSTFGLALSASADNSAKQPAANSEPSAPAKPEDQRNQRGASGQDKDTGAARKVEGEEGARAAGAGPSVPREGNGAATSGGDNKGTSGQSGNSQDTTR